MRYPFLPLILLTLSLVLTVPAHSQLLAQSANSPSAQSSDSLDPDETEIEADLDHDEPENDSLDADEPEFSDESSDSSLDSDEPEFSDESSEGSLDSDEGELLDSEEGEFDENATVDDSSLDSEEDDAVFDSSAVESEDKSESLWDKLSAPARLSIRQELAYRVKDPEKLVTNRTSLRLKWERLFEKNYFVRFDGKSSYNSTYDYHEYPREVERRYRRQNLIREFYLQASFGQLSFKVGKQIVVWGEADGSVVTDVISPRDSTEFVFTPLEDSRIGQSMIVVQYYLGGQWTFVLNPDVQTDRSAKAGHEYAFPSLEGNGITLLEDEKPETNGREMEYGFRWKRTFGSSDLSVMLANLVDNAAVLRSKGINDGGELELQNEYKRFSMVGLAGNLASGNFLWKAEIAGKYGKTFNLNNFLEGDGTIEKDVIDSALGVEFNANGAYTLTLEGSNQHIVDWDENLFFVERDTGNLYLTWSKGFMHDTFTPQYIYAYAVQDEDGFHQLRTTYQFTDQLTFIFGGTYFAAKEDSTFLSNFKDAHRIDFEAEYFF